MLLYLFVADVEILMAIGRRDVDDLIITTALSGENRNGANLLLQLLFLMTLSPELIARVHDGNS